MNRYSLAVLVLSVAIIVLAIWRSDWDSLFVPIIGIAVMSAPMIATGDPEKGYDSRLVGIAIISLIVFIVMFVANLFFEFKYYHEVALAVQALSCMAFGTMIAIYFNARARMTLPRRWVVLFGFIFACSISALWTFSTIYWMYATGYPIYNGDFTGKLSNDTVNMMLMLPMTVMTFSAIIYSVAFNEYMKRADSMELSRFSSGGVRH